MGYSGNLVKSQAPASQAPDARQFPAPDQAHGVLDEADPNAAKWQVPAGTAVDVGSSDFPQVVTNTPGLLLSTPTGSHDSPALHMSYPDNTSWQQDIGTAHDGEADRGFMESDGTYYAPELQFAQTSTDYEYVQGNGSPAPVPVVLQRGRNSNEVNNPDVVGYDPGGYRRGFFRLASVFRTTRHDNKVRVYDHQPEWGRDILVQQSSPAAVDAPYWAPFADSMARAVTRVQMTPALAREGVDMAQADTAYGAATMGGDSSVIGIGW